MTPADQQPGQPDRPELPPFVRRHGPSFRAVVTIDGKRVVSHACATPEEAAEAATKIRTTRIPPRILTMRSGFDLVLADLEETGARPDTVTYYKNHFRLVTQEWPEHWPLHRITADGIRRYVERRRADGIALATIWGKELQVVARILRLAHTRGHLPENPMEGMRRPRLRQGRFGVLTMERVAALVAAIRAWRNDDGQPARVQDRDADIVSLMALTGLRRAEASRLRPQDIDRDHGRIFVDGKTGNRYLPITDELDPVLARLTIGKASDASIVGSVRTMEQLFARWQERLGEPLLTPHVLRHTFATAMVRAGVESFVLAELMGHSDLRMTRRYYHSQSDRNRSALERLTLRPGSASAGQSAGQTTPAAAADDDRQAQRSSGSPA